jgi:NAD(P)-dependent dehydrogenase (short-subunit alcohol dehydrogenase family)
MGYSKGKIMANLGVRMDGKHALIIGASSGIGLAVSEAYIEYGAEVTILAIDDTIHEAAHKLTKTFGSPVKALQCDVSDQEALRTAMAEIARIDVLVYNAGFERLTPVTRQNPDVEENFHKIFDVNLFGALYATREALSKIPDGGRIIYTASTYSKYAISQMSGYLASKHALLGMMRSFSQDLGSRRITVNAICPGWVNTEFSNRSVREIATDTGRSIQDVGNDVLSMQAIPGHLEPHDMVGGYLFLASDLARDITGQSLHIDRGECQN